MNKRVWAVILAVLVFAAVLTGCHKSVWGSENLLPACEGKGTEFADSQGLFTLTAPEGFRDATAEDTDHSNLMLTDGEIEIRVTRMDYIQNAAAGGQEEYEAEYKNLGMKLTSYTRGKVLGENGIKIMGSYKAEDGTAMQQLQYAFNHDGAFYVFTCSYPTQNAKAAKKTLASILGSFEA